MSCLLFVYYRGVNIVTHKVIEREEGGVIAPFFEVQCPYCSFLFLIDVPSIDISSAFFCHRCKQKIDSKKING